jgi:cytoskeletal protein CcmA (bactofilin family)
MFSSKPKDLPAAPVASMAAPPVARRNGRGTVPSIVSADLTVEGNLTSAGDIQVDGIVQGDIRSNGLVVGEHAEIHGEIFAEEVTVRGKVMGRIHARKVQLAATSRVEGDILHESFSVETGAFFEGNCRHSDNPLGSDQKRPPAPKTETPQPAQSFMNGLAAQGT